MNIKKKLALLLVAIMMMCSLVACGEEDHNDGKCDICGKRATYSDADREEYCDKHLEDAVEWYLEKSMD